MRNRGLFAAVAAWSVIFSASAADKAVSTNQESLEYIAKVCGDVADYTMVEDCAQRLQKMEKVEGSLKNIDQIRRDRANLGNPSAAGFGFNGDGMQSVLPGGVVPPSQGFAVEYVKGHEGNYTAALIDASGRRLFVKKSSSPAPSITVAEVSLHRVVVESNGKKMELPFAPKRVASSGLSGTSQGAAAVGALRQE